MAKRFIDTNIFNDEWFCDLSKDCKLFFIYYITQCDHAGVLRLNRKLCEFQTGLKSLETVIKELGNCLVTVKENVFFLPKFLKFQYPNFPNSNVKQQDGALKILEGFGIDFNNYLTVNKELPNSYVYVSVNDNDNNKEESIDFSLKKEEKKSTVKKPLEDRKKDFMLTIKKYKDEHPEKYPTRIYNDFYKYWTENDGKQMRFEDKKNKYFEVGRRLVRFWVDLSTEEKSAMWQLEKDKPKA